MVTSRARAPWHTAPCDWAKFLSASILFHIAGLIVVCARHQLRGFIPRLAKRLTKSKRLRLGLSSEGVVKKSVNKKGRQVVLLALVIYNCYCNINSNGWILTKDNLLRTESD